MPADAAEVGAGALRGASCLVLGAGGFIGSHLCRALLQRGARVHGFGRGNAASALPGTRWTQGEFRDRAALARAVDGAEYVFHLLGSSTPASSNKDPAADLVAGPLASLQLLELCRAAGVRKLVFMSSGGTVYGVAGALPIPETAPTDPISAYGVGKLTTEKHLHVYEHLHGLPYAALRLANPYGPGQDPERRQGLVAALMQAALDGREAEIWGDGTVVRDYLFIDDAVEAVIQAATYAGAERVFNVGSGLGRSILDLVRDIGAVAGAGGVLRVLHKPSRTVDVPANVLDIGRIGREMGWRPHTDWQAGLEQTAAWLRRRAA